jgi:hypothetical protein
MEIVFLFLFLVSVSVSASRDADYEEMLEKRRQVLDMHPDVVQSTEVWQLFREAWPCPTTKRFGRLGDGGKWLCYAHHNCTVLSLGIQDEFSFEQDLVEHKKCKIYGYDPTIDGSEDVRRTMTFFKKGVRGSAHDGDPRVPGPFLSVKEMLQEIHLGRVDILKVDVEGAEYGMFRDLFTDFPDAMPFDQLLIEFHLFRHDVKDVVRIVETLETKYGFRIFETELNPYDPKHATEMSLVHI